MLIVLYLFGVFSALIVAELRARKVARQHKAAALAKDAEHRASIDRLEEAAEERLEHEANTWRNRLEREVSQVAKDSHAAIDALEKEARQQLESLNAAHQAQSVALLNTCDAHVRAACEQLAVAESTIAEQQGTINELERLNAQLEREKAGTIEGQRKQIENVRTRMVSLCLARVKEALGVPTSKLESVFREIRQEAKDFGSLEALRCKYAKELEALNQSHQAELAALGEKHQAELAALTPADLQTKIADLESQVVALNTEKCRTVEHYRKALEAAKRPRVKHEPGPSALALRVKRLNDGKATPEDRAILRKQFGRLPPESALG